MILKFTRNCKGTRTAKTVLKKQNKIGRFALPNFKTGYKATVMRAVWCRHRIDEDMWAEAESPLIFWAGFFEAV